MRTGHTYTKSCPQTVPPGGLGTRLYTKWAVQCSVLRLTPMAASGSASKEGDGEAHQALPVEDSRPITQTTSSCRLTAAPNASAAPCWLKDGVLQADTLKAEIGRCTAQLSAGEKDGGRQQEGADLLYETVMDIWGLETGQVSRAAADIACDEIR